MLRYALHNDMNRKYPTDIVWHKVCKSLMSFLPLGTCRYPFSSCGWFLYKAIPIHNSNNVLPGKHKNIQSTQNKKRYCPFIFQFLILSVLNKASYYPLLYMPNGIVTYFMHKYSMLFVFLTSKTYPQHSLGYFCTKKRCICKPLWKQDSWN